MIGETFICLANEPTADASCGRSRQTLEMAATRMRSLLAHPVGMLANGDQLSINHFTESSSPNKGCSPCGRITRRAILGRIDEKMKASGFAFVRIRHSHSG